jgi:uncharacterized protein YecE (DUF72 family)
MATYVQRFPLVEVQHTFYEPPNDAMLVRWRSQAPTRFEFTMKAWQRITHESGSPTYRRERRKLTEEERGHVGAFRSTPPVLEAWARTLACARLLRATAVLLQCPRSFRPTPDNVSRMRTFLTTVELDLVHVVDPMQTETVTPEQTYYRLHGTTGSRHVHTDDELRRLRDLVDGRPNPYVLFNNLPRVGDAQRFLDLL